MTDKADTETELAEEIAGGELAEIDRQLMSLFRRRAEVASRALALDARKDPFRFERATHETMKTEAARHGVSVESARAVANAVVGELLLTQERDAMRSASSGRGRTVLVIGGAGRMGQWLARFLDRVGCDVTISDPAGPVRGYDFVRSGVEVATRFDLIFVAAPLGSTGAILSAIAARSPEGIVAEIGSLKSPVLHGLHALRTAGVRAVSIHPMFGPSAERLAGRHVIFAELADPTEREREASAELEALFEDTMVERVHMPLEEHDRKIAYVLGLSHAMNIVFGLALARAADDADTLARLSSTTFDAQLEVSGRVASENPHLYYEIQALNEHGDDALRAFESAVADVHAAIRDRDEQRFVGFMRESRRWFQRRARVGSADE